MVATMSWISSAGSSGPWPRSSRSTADRSFARSAGVAEAGSCWTTASLHWESQARRGPDTGAAPASPSRTRGARGMRLVRDLARLRVQEHAASVALRCQVVDEDAGVEFSDDEPLTHQADEHHAARLHRGLQLPSEGSRGEVAGCRQAVEHLELCHEGQPTAATRWAGQWKEGATDKAVALSLDTSTSNG